MYLKDYFIGIFPDQKTVETLTDISARAAEIFSTQGIPIRWMQPDKYNISILFAGKSLNFFKKKFISYRLGKYEFKPFEISMGHIKLGISKKYRELVFFTVEDGADQMRDMVLDLSGKLKVQRESAFIPHITLGRVNKDLSDMEFKNLTDDITRLNKLMMKMPAIKFAVKKLYFVESDGENFKLV